MSEMKIRCSSLGKIMSGVAKGWDVENSKTCKEYLRALHREYHWKRRKVITNKFVQKGLKEEESGITLLSRHLKIPLFKNKVRFNGDFLTGEPDILLGEDMRFERVIDIKCSWNFDTFPFASDVLDPDYDLQVRGYMNLTGAGLGTVAYTLVNAPANLIDKEKKSLWYNMGCPDESKDVFVEGCINIEKNMIYDIEQFRKDNPGYIMQCENWNYDISLTERVCEFHVIRDMKFEEKITNRIAECKDYLLKIK